MHHHDTTDTPGLQWEPRWRGIDAHLGRLRRLADKAEQAGLFCLFEDRSMLATHWLIESRSDPDLAHEVTILNGSRLEAKCDCAGWEFTGACMHVALALKTMRLGPWQPTAEPVATAPALGAAWLRARLNGEA